MVKGSRYRVPLRRRREVKTDYQARKAFVLSGRPRLVARSSLKNTIAQIVVAKPHGDEVLASAHSRELVRTYGWKGATGNIPAAYLTGLLCGLKAKKAGVPEAILDIGLVKPTKGSKVFATMSGVLDAGVVIPHDEAKLVKDRLKGEHIAKYAKSLGEPEEYAPQFSQTLAAGVAPAKLPEHVSQVKANILTAFGIAVKPEPKEAKEVKEAKPEAKAAKAVKPAKGEAKKASAKAPAKTEKAEKAEKVAKPKAEKKAEKAERKPVKSEAKSGGKKE